jgi:hypothetical protein
MAFIRRFSVRPVGYLRWVEFFMQVPSIEVI